MCRSATSESTKGSKVQAIASASSRSASRPPGSTSRSPASAGNTNGISGASAHMAIVPEPSSSAVIVSGSACSTRRLLSDPNSATNSADTVPTKMPMRMPAGTPPTTSATPGSTATPSATSRHENRLRASRGSTSAVNTVASAMHVAPTDAFASLIDP
jgi:hypothetical protein